MWPAIFLVGGLLLLASEAFLPTLGVFGILGFVCLIAGIVMAWKISATLGAGIFISLFVLIPPSAWLFIKILPKTRLGKRLIPCPTLEEVQPEDDPKDAMRQLIGEYGVTQTPMLPSGLVRIGDRDWDAVADGTAIEAGCSVRVTEVRMRRLMVVPAVPPTKTETSEEGGIETMERNPFQWKG